MYTGYWTLNKYYYYYYYYYYYLQFGYKRNSSTVMCTTMLSETIEYYVSNNSHVFVLYMDTSKAFDRVCHSKLFDVLQAQGMCPLILRALFNIEHVYSF